jgi:hypothetical protein
MANKLDSVGSRAGVGGNDLAVDSQGDLRPAYYQQGSLQPWDVIDAFQLDFYGGNVLRYLLRCGKKSEEEGGGTIKDLIKCRTYINKMLKNAGYVQPGPPAGDAQHSKIQNTVASDIHKTLTSGNSLRQTQRRDLVSLLAEYFDV